MALSVRPTALILSGGARYTDAWHDFPSTSQRLAAVLEAGGFDVEIADDVDERMQRLRDVDLLVTNMGDPTPNGEPTAASTDVRAGLLDYVRRGGPVLALHISSWAFPGIAEWNEHIGCTWVRGVSSHPDDGPSHVTVARDRDALVEGVPDFDLIDERYCFLDVAPDVVGLVTHHLYGIDHPLLWKREHHGARVVYSALGHSVRSYDSPEHRELLGRAAHWLVGAKGTSR